MFYLLCPGFHGGGQSRVVFPISGGMAYLLNVCF